MTEQARRPGGHPPARDHGEMIVIPRAGSSAVRLRLVDAGGYYQDHYYMVVEIDGETFTVNGWDFSAGNQNLPASVRERLAGVLPLWDSDEAYYSSRMSWDGIIRRLIADRALWEIVTFMATRTSNGVAVDDDFIDRAQWQRERGVPFGPPPRRSIGWLS